MIGGYLPLSKTILWGKTAQIQVKEGYAARGEGIIAVLNGFQSF